MCATVTCPVASGNVCNAETHADATEDYTSMVRTWFLIGFILTAVSGGIRILQFVAQFQGDAGAGILLISVIPVILASIVTQVWIIWGAVVRWGGDGAGGAASDLPVNKNPMLFMMIYLIFGFIGVAACACVCCCLVCAACGIGAAAAAGKAASADN